MLGSQYRTLVNTGDDDAPRLHGNCILELAPACPSAEAFCARLAGALRLRAAAAEEAPGGDADELARAARAAIAALHATGDIRRGAAYACPNGHIYAVGECGQPMERASCHECGAPIGGEQHRPADGNTLRRDMDDAGGAGGGDARAYAPRR
jgi:hypothetical protein